MKKFAAGIGMVMVGAVFALPTFAQSVDEDALTYIATAFENTKAQESYTLSSQSATEITGFPGAGDDPVMQQTSEINLAGESASGTVSMETNLSFGGQGVQSSSTTELVIVEGEVYLRFTDTPEMQGETEITLPEGWFQPDELDEEAGGLIGGVAENIGGVLELAISADSVTELTELEADTIDDQGMRVFQLTLNTEYVAESGVAGLFGAGNGGGLGGLGGGFPGAQGGQPPADFTPPADMAEMPEGTFEAPTASDTKITLAVWVGDDDGLVHRIYSVIAIEPGAESQMPISLQVTTVTDFSNFGETFEITAPETE